MHDTETVSLGSTCRGHGAHKSRPANTLVSLRVCTVVWVGVIWSGWVGGVGLEAQGTRGISDDHRLQLVMRHRCPDVPWDQVDHLCLRSGQQRMASTHAV